MPVNYEIDEIINLSKTLNNAIEFSCENGEDSSYTLTLSRMIYEKLKILRHNIKQLNV